jgi:hypothetical protein
VPPGIVELGKHLTARRPDMGAAGISENDGAIPARAAVGARMRRGMVATVERGVARMASRRRRRHALQREEFTEPWTAGLSRGLTLLGGERRPVPRREEEL